MNGDKTTEISGDEKNPKDKIYEDEQNRIELSYFSRCKAYIVNVFLSEIRNQIDKEYSGGQYYLDSQGFMHTRYYSLSEDSLDYRVRVETEDIEQKPYFAHVCQEQDANIYIGKKEVPGWVIDWSSPKARRYYDNFAEEIGNEENRLIFVRDIIIKRGRYIGFRDQYNINGNDQMVESTDEQLKRILAANREKKNVHDIIESIKVNQYRIISSSKDDNMLVLGCAGSGKTMVLMHKIRYMKYNYPDLDMSDIIVISPTNVLGRENKELARILEVDKVQQFSNSDFYQIICNEICTKARIEHESFRVVDSGDISKNYYNEKKLEQIERIVSYNIQDGYWSNSQIEEVELMLNEHKKLLGNNEKKFQTMYTHYQKSSQELNKYNANDVADFIKRIDDSLSVHAYDVSVMQILSFLLQKNCFKDVTEKKTKTEDELKHQFFYTTKYIRERFGETVLSDDAISEALLKDFYEYWKVADDTFEKMVDEWKTATTSDVSSYLELLRKYVKNGEELKRGRDILTKLLEKGLFKKKSSEPTQIRSLGNLKEVLNLFSGTEQLLQNSGFTPLSYFEYYEKIKRKLNRLNRGSRLFYIDNTLLFDCILSQLGIESICEKEIMIPSDKAFALLYILQNKCKYVNKKKHYIYIDEFQDYSKTELETIIKMFPNAVINLFGDVRQCISVKGITDITDIPSKLQFRRYELNENYRNANQITKYINEIFQNRMCAVGLDGVQKVVQQIPSLDICEDDRIAVIVAAKEDISETDKERFEFYYYTDTNMEIKRGVYNVIPVGLTKGLEFEKVVVIKEHMSDNQFYVACTRAINELYVVER